MKETIGLQKKAKGERPVYFADPAIDKVIAITMALAGETAVLRDRLDTIERLLEEGRPISRKAIDDYIPGEQVRADRDAWRDVFLANILRIVHQEREALERSASEKRSYQEVVELVEAAA